MFVNLNKEHSPKSLERVIEEISNKRERKPVSKKLIYLLNVPIIFIVRNNPKLGMKHNKTIEPNKISTVEKPYTVFSS